MHEELFKALLSRYQDSGMSLDRVIVDPRFKSLPLVDKVELLKEHGHTIHAGSKIDRQFWKDIGWGAVGTGIALADPILTSLHNFQKGVSYGAATRNADNPSEIPRPVMETKGYKDLALKATGAGLAAPKFYAALAARNNMRMVKRLLNEQPGSTSTEDAINVIARS